MIEIENFLDTQNELGEGPLWQPLEQALYWVNVAQNNYAVYRWYAATGGIEKFDFDLPVTALGMRDSGGFVAATKRGFAFWSPADNALDFIGDPEADRPDTRFNDGAVDGQGRFWAGTMMPDRETSSLYVLDAEGQVHQMDTGMIVSNGLGWSPDQKTMYFTDSFRHTIYAYDFDPVSGAIKNRRPFVFDPDDAGVPDGLAVDSEGFVWSVRCGGWKITRYGPAGNVERQIRLPVQCPTSGAFGGKNLDELYITTSRSLVRDGTLGDQPLAGNILRLRPGIRGMAEPLFKG